MSALEAHRDARVEAEQFESGALSAEEYARTPFEADAFFTLYAAHRQQLAQKPPNAPELFRALWSLVAETVYIVRAKHHAIYQSVLRVGVRASAAVGSDLIDYAALRQERERWSKAAARFRQLIEHVMRDMHDLYGRTRAQRTAFEAIAAEIRDSADFVALHPDTVQGEMKAWETEATAAAVAGGAERAVAVLPPSERTDPPPAAGAARTMQANIDGLLEAHQRLVQKTGYKA